MSDAASATLQPNSAIPADDPNHKLTVGDPDSSKVRHVAAQEQVQQHRQTPEQIRPRHDCDRHLAVC